MLVYQSPLPTWFLFRFLCAAVLLLFVFSCKKPEPQINARPAFYHWKTNLSLTPGERAAIDSLGVEKLYVKFFDVDWDAASQQPVPLAEVQIDTTYIYGLEIVPTVFITNRVFKNLSQGDKPEKEVLALAERVGEKIVRQFGSLQFSEVQIDCDWTESTRERYFQFLRTLSSQFSALHSQLKISATIRLHQYKYPERTGVPPVDRGMLMLYNMGEVAEWETENSIFDLEILETYIPVTSHQSPITQYPLPLDLALPTFHWGVVFRGGFAEGEKPELAYLINDLGEEDLRDTARFAKLTETRYEVRKNTYLEGYFLYRGDRVRLEGVTPEVLGKAVSNFPGATGLNRSLSENGEVATVAFYHLDTNMLKTFDHEKLERILQPPMPPKGGF